MAKTTKSSAPALHPKEPVLIGKPVKVVSMKGSKGWKCGGCDTVRFNGVMFDVAGVYYCTRDCAKRHTA